MNMTEKIKNLLKYVGVMGAFITSIAYLIITIILIAGFESSLDIQKQIIFSLLGAFSGLMISSFLKTQGIELAKQDEDASKTMEEYTKLKNKDKKEKELKTINYYFIKSTIQDIFTKGLTIASTTSLAMYVFLEGSGDWSLLGLAIVNILMFTCFGLVSLSKYYDLYLEQHIPAIKERIIRLKEKLKGETEDVKTLQHQCEHIATTSEREQREHPEIMESTSSGFYNITSDTNTDIS